MHGVVRDEEASAPAFRIERGHVDDWDAELRSDPAGRFVVGAVDLEDLLVRKAVDLAERRSRFFRGIRVVR
jgi:hypothetical protein